MEDSKNLFIFGIQCPSLNLNCKNMLKFTFCLVLALLAYDAQARVPTGVARFDKMTDKFRAYVSKYSDLAIEEHARFGVPASITLAQGLLESAAGTSDHVRLANNHFGIKAKTKNNLFQQLAIGWVWFSEGKFAKYNSAWWCFRHHSKLLTNGSYAHIKDQAGNNYKYWAYLIKKAGYAEDPSYATKVIKLIDTYELWRYDGHARSVSNPNVKII